MPSLKDFFSWWPRRRPPTPLVQIRPELLTAVQKIAAQENLPVGVVVNDLLRFALAERRVSNETMILWQQLTDREKEVTVLIWMGMTNPEIAAHLVISENTVKTHIRNIFAKFDLNSKDNLRLALSNLDFSEWVESWLPSSPPAPDTD